MHLNVCIYVYTSIVLHNSIWIQIQRFTVVFVSETVRFRGSRVPDLAFWLNRSRFKVSNLRYTASRVWVNLGV
ncbi:hypothetical protein ACOSP7_008238 [Xanthoceras sorbifolium]